MARARQRRPAGAGAAADRGWHQTGDRHPYPSRGTDHRTVDAVRRVVMAIDVRTATPGCGSQDQLMSSPRLSRRRVLGIGAAAGAVAVVGGALPWLASRDEIGRQQRSDIPLPAPFQLPLPIPPVLQPAADGDVDRYDIVQRAATVELLPGV